MNWFLYAIASPALYSLTNYIEKFLVEKRVKNPLLVPTFGGLIILLLGILILAIKHFPILPLMPLILIILSGVFLYLYLIPYFQALVLDETSRIVPLFGASPIFVLIMSYLFLGESLSMKQIFGFVLILIGGFAISSKKIDLKIFIPRKTFWLMMVSAFLWSITVILFKFVVISSDFWTTFAYESIGTGLASIVVLIVKWREIHLFVTKSFKRDIVILFILNSIVGVIAQYSFSVAILLAPAALVSIIGGTQPFFVLVFGVFLSLFFPHIIKENIERKVLVSKILLIVLIFTGIVLIYY
ncbi:MAG: hypothetical protein A3D74_05690 [Candidatus Levybacteria bacterium RIFCSPHIGHO2_02_FULL_37_13]|nr:MAG: hypothetical protein A3D74_05690 [Candidatus Levybacteria bacterium RIFCSPHIGHO2_02_FULL_37_13]OGH29099.1 MAG: hypothetical protein A3E40_03045 [Candidatus Levybacteria bacterium RIFCSPHIGHO2_12_FULL_37_9]OGH39770.1 MAG: hypothetical protein A3B41_03910 [Candidatus Levybacteria bacterium RIFCSPLOWO2_01_FULL_37_26]